MPKQGTKSSNEESKFTNDPESFGMKIIPWSDDYLKFVAEGNTFQNYINKHGVVSEEMFRVRQRFASNNGTTQKRLQICFSMDSLEHGD